MDHGVDAIGAVPSGLFLLTTDSDAVLISWVQQASFEPLRISLAMAKDRPILEAIKARGTFALNIFKDGEKAWYKAYAAGNPEPFKDVDERFDEEGNRILPDAETWMTIKLVDIHDHGGDHITIYGDVIGGARSEGFKSAVWTRKSGAGY